MSLLLAFEAAGRHENYTVAAKELSLTQGAISRQVQALEAQLGLALFQREGRSVRLTEIGRLYHIGIAESLGKIRGATLQAMTHSSGVGTLRLATLPTLGSKWLLPLLPDFYQRHPGITVHLNSRIGNVDFGNGELDAAITVGAPPSELISHPLFEEQLIAIAPVKGSKPRETAATARTIVDRPLLTVATNPQAWTAWFSAHGMDPQKMRAGPRFELTSHLVQAVMAGIGVGLVPLALVKDELSQRKVIAVGKPIPSQRAYCLVYPQLNRSLPSLIAFRDWLLTQRIDE